MQGAWASALDEAAQACERLSAPKVHPAIGAAHYQRGDLHRLRGEFSEAEEAYRQADLHGQATQPGLAQLRLAQGQVAAAATSIRRAIDEASSGLLRSRVLSAYVEIMFAAGDVAAARSGADVLARLAVGSGATFLEAAAAHATGATLLVEGEIPRALAELHRAHALWRTIDVPYDGARTRVLIGIAYDGLGDIEAARLELQAAHEVFERLGARPDLAQLDQRTGRTTALRESGLTERELHILRLVATGKTNRTIAEELVLSEKTVARHLSNIFAKLGVSSRAGATAYAYDHHLLQQPA
jgi:DNA-binding CsgD family transcriptional regulator/Flp pilus assembly protein TadD